MYFNFWSVFLLATTCSSAASINVSSRSVTGLQDHAVIAHMLYSVIGQSVGDTWNHTALPSSRRPRHPLVLHLVPLWNKLLKIAVIHIVLGLFWREPRLRMLVFHGLRHFNHLCTVTWRAPHLDSFLFCIKGLDTNARCHLLRPTNQKQWWWDERTGLRLLWALQDFMAQWRTGCRSTLDTIYSSGDLIRWERCYYSVSFPRLEGLSNTLLGSVVVWYCDLYLLQHGSWCVCVFKTEWCIHWKLTFIWIQNPLL